MRSRRRDEEAIASMGGKAVESGRLFTDRQLAAMIVPLFME